MQTVEPARKCTPAINRHLVCLWLTASPPTTPRLPPNMAASAIASASGQSIHRLLCQQYMHSMTNLLRQGSAWRQQECLQLSEAAGCRIEFRLLQQDDSFPRVQSASEADHAYCILHALLHVPCDTLGLHTCSAAGICSVPPNCACPACHSLTFAQSAAAECVCV